MSYPIRARYVPRYMRWGYSWSAIQSNVVGSLPGLEVFASRDAIRFKLDERASKSVLPRGTLSIAADRSPDDSAKEAAYALIAKRYTSDERVLAVRPYRDSGHITSAEIETARGNYIRVELDSAFFREKQRRNTRLLSQQESFAPDRSYWNTFVAILDLFQSRGVRLIVNEMVEAPNNYANPHEREVAHAFMNTVRAEVERRSIPYVRADFDRLTDSDYFDYNHLNSVGIAKYDDMLVPLLRPLLTRR